MPWFDSIVPEIASRRAIIFIGSGTSAFSSNAAGQHPPTWSAFLNDAISHFVTDEDDLRCVEELMRDKQYLDAAEVVFTQIDNPEADSFFRNTFLTPNFHPAEIHQIIQDLDSKIVISTNYDTIYEKQCNLPTPEPSSYITKKYNEADILDEIRSPTRLIIKAHGCVNDPRHIILTRSQYFKARSSYPTFYSLLDSLFHTHTVVFIGCGLNDPDIQLILENANISVPCGHPHYAFALEERHPAIVKAIRDTYNIKLIEYKNPDGTHTELIKLLNELNKEVDSYRRTYLNE
jgi:hypothetical protein